MDQSDWLDELMNETNCSPLASTRWKKTNQRGSCLEKLIRGTEGAVERELSRRLDDQMIYSLFPYPFCQYTGSQRFSSY